MMGSMLPKQILTIVLYGVGLTSITAMVYLAGPMIAFGVLSAAGKLHRSPDCRRSGDRRICIVRRLQVFPT